VMHRTQIKMLQLLASRRGTGKQLNFTSPLHDLLYSFTHWVYRNGTETFLDTGTGPRWLTMPNVVVVLLGTCCIYQIFSVLKLSVCQPIVIKLRLLTGDSIPDFYAMSDF